MRPPSPSIPEKEFLASALDQSLRLDGRALLEMRAPELTFGSELGCVECALGKTRVLAQVDAKMVRPPPERPYEGFITIHSEISPMASIEYEPGRPSDEEVALSRMLDKVLRRSDAVDKEALCVLAGQRVWHLRITIHCLADAGNLLDCACLAGIVALKHFRRPDVEVVGDEITIVCLFSIHQLLAPLCLSLYTISHFASPSPISLLPPRTKPLAYSTLPILNSASAQAGGLPLAPEEILKAVGIAVGKAKELEKFVEEKLRVDWVGRKVEVQ
ncbi:hypothetical protein EW146_g5022 [Bondarzewia mesenterica]|uniref:Exoribonuclease phosphorolytic domain-containing protein n=1 Tax=Bondarzewia mesenterica TaxID=1095465 RepID=A0A4S4LTS2_9AGAM|nr:hypothetical protein EW146_g5022 [Bondarzewia mesenterica]